MTTHLILGAGPIGSALAERLLARGHSVRVGTRSGTALTGAEAIALDAADADAVARAAEGCTAIHLATNPPYHRWPEQWPPMADAVIEAARRTGAGVVMTGNLYPYGRPGGVMSDASTEAPTEGKGRARAEVWRRLREAHGAGEIRAAEVRASDYFGPRTPATNHLGRRFVEAVAAGRTARVVGDPDAPHAWAYVGDIASSLAEVGTREDLWGRVWIAPHSTQESLREMAVRFAAAAGAPSPTVTRFPGWLVGGLSLVSPVVREVRAVDYQHSEPYLVESSSELGAPTLIDEAIALTLAWYGVGRERAARPAA